MKYRQKKFIGALFTLALACSMSPTPASAQAKCTKRCPSSQKDAKGCCQSCSEGKIRSKTSDYRCCWPDQAWSKTQNQCIGIPTCPQGMTLKKGTCHGRQSTKAKLDDIRALLVLTGSVKLAMLSVEKLIQSYKNLLPQVPNAFWTRFKTQFDDKALINLIIPVYDKHLTHADIKALLVFYKSDVGKKYVKVMPDIQRDSKLVGQQWGLLIAQAIEKKLKEEGYLKKD